MNLKRYSRQTVLPEIGLEGQERLGNARVLCVGMGGLGSPVSLYLAAAGVGTLGLVDDDRVESTNLQRQILFENSDIGESKVEAARKKLMRQNPDVQIEVFNERLIAANAEQVFQSYDLIVDGSDNFATRFLTHDAALKKQIPWVYGAVNQFEGQTALFTSGSRHDKNSDSRGPCYRCLYPHLPRAQIQNCAEAGVLGSIVGTVGTLQATLALQYLISAGNPNHPLCPPVGQLSIFDFAGRWNISTIQVPQQPDCPSCSIAPAEIVLRDADAFCTTKSGQRKSIRATDLLMQMRMKENPVLLFDVRDSDEWETGHIADAIHWPLHRIEKGEIPPLPAGSTTIVVYCQTGLRSARAAHLLNLAGVQSVLNLEGGIHAWPPMD